MYLVLCSRTAWKVPGAHSLDEAVSYSPLYRGLERTKSNGYGIMGESLAVLVQPINLAWLVYMESPIW